MRDRMSSGANAWRTSSRSLRDHIVQGGKSRRRGKVRRRSADKGDLAMNGFGSPPSPPFFSKIDYATHLSSSYMHQHPSLPCMIVPEYPLTHFDVYAVVLLDEW